jgi:hypothetical protein
VICANHFSEEMLPYGSKDSLPLDPILREFTTVHGLQFTVVQMCLSIGLLTWVYQGNFQWVYRVWMSHMRKALYVPSIHFDITSPIMPSSPM